MWIGSTIITRTRKVTVNPNKVKATPKIVGNNISKKKRKRIKQYVVDVLL